MANQEHIDILKQGVEVWNKWRKEYPEVQPDLRKANLNHASLAGANLRDVEFNSASLVGTNLVDADLSSAGLSSTNLSGTNISGASLICADLIGAHLVGAHLSEAHFIYANLIMADVRGANLTHTNLTHTNLTGANLAHADLSDARVGWTIFGNLDLRTVKGLETLMHISPSTIGTDTILRSEGDIPESFLRGAGLDDTFISYVLSLVKRPIQYYTCFISYSSKDQAFAERLYADLQSKNVRCWYAPEDLKIGDKFWHRIDESIRLYDKLLVILSEHSVASAWVENEVMAAFEKEHQQPGKTVLFPIKLDNTVMETNLPWAANMRRMRHIGDFTRWKEHDEYQKGLSRLLRDLKQDALPDTHTK